MRAFIDTLTKSDLQAIVNNGIASEVAKHKRRNARQRVVTNVKTKVAKVKTIRVRNPFTFKK